jgi:hypothetical protein
MIEITKNSIWLSETGNKWKVLKIKDNLVKVERISTKETHWWHYQSLLKCKKCP